VADQAIMCTLSAGELGARGQRWGRLRDRATAEVAPTEAGLRLRFRADPGIEAELRELAALERECCSFADWTVTVDRGSVCLDITAEGEAVPAVQSMFASFVSDTRAAATARPTV
jgi:hypothetical protein